MSPWEWFATTAPAGALINALGLGALAVLFATDRVLTRGQHARRVADIVKTHDERIDELKASHTATIGRIEKERDYERKRSDDAVARADALSARLNELATELGGTAVQLLKALPTSPEGGE